MAVTTYLANFINNDVLRNDAQTSPTAVYLALYTTPTDNDGSGTEATGGSYARQAFTADASVAGIIENNAAITFSNMPGSQTYTHVALLDAVTGGNMLCHGPLATSLTPSAGSEVVFETGEISLGIA